MKDILYNIIYYPLPIIWCFIFILIFIKRKNLYYYIKLLFIFFFISLTPFFSTLLEYPLLQGMHNYTKQDNISIVLVPTAGIYKDNKSNWHPSVNTVLRVSQGEKLAKKLDKPLFISGGIVNSEDISEAEVVKNIVVYKNTIFEDKSRNSYETIVNFQNIFFKDKDKDKANDKRVLLVTSPHHIMRMSLLLKSNGFLVSNYYKKENKKITLYYFIPDASMVYKINSIMYEYMAIIKYIFLKYIRINSYYA